VVLYLYGLRTERRAVGHVESVEEVAVDIMVWTILPFCARWRSYSIHIIVVDPLDHWNNVIPLTEFHPVLSNLDVPMLEEFSIEEETYGLDSTTSLLHRFSHGFPPPHPASSWNLPALHTLTLRNTPASEMPSEFRRPLRSAWVSYVRRKLIHHLNTLQSLSIATSLMTLQLSFTDCHFSKILFDSSPIVISHVKYLHFDFLGCSQISSDEQCLWKSFRNLRFPDVVDLSILLDIGNASFVLWDAYGCQPFDMTLQSVLVTDINPPCPFPRLETLDIEVRPRRRDGGPALLLPHCCLPSLKHLRIQSSFNLTLLDCVRNDHEATLLARQFAMGRKIAPIALHTVTFEAPRADGIVWWMRDLALKMQDQLCWGNFVELTVITAENEVQVIPRDEVEHWCADNILRVQNSIKWTSAG